MLAFALLFGLAAGNVDDMAKREAYKAELLRMLPASEPWEAWLEQSGELPPDFDALPSQAYLPDPLAIESEDGPRRVDSIEAWETRRAELLDLLKHWIIGTVPPRPDNLEAKVLSETQEAGARRREVELRFGPDHKAFVHLELLIPDGPGPFPVFLTQDNHRAWALIALRRGYLACVYAGADSRDDTASFIEAYPEHDWSKLTRRAWAGSRCIDYLETVPEARLDQIGITGHSRNGKQSLIASALDTRIAAVISSSSGAGGSLPARYYGEHYFGEGIENITRVFPDWFHPRWRFFAGREHKLPVDLHTLVAMSAPRPCLLSIALNDGVESTWAMEQTYHAVQPVYGLYNAPERLEILYRPAGHETWPTVIELYLDWFDAQFGRGNTDFPDRAIHPRDWEAWSRRAGTALDPSAYPARPFGSTDAPLAREATQAAIHDMLGTPVPSAAGQLGTYGEEPDHIERMLGRADAGKGLEKHDLVFGDYLNGDVYMPVGTKESGARIPAVLWLHPWSLPQGYGAAYRRGEQAFRTLARAGFAVFCYDQIGFGRRIEEVEGFYDRYPHGSLLAHMLRDARAAIDALAELPFVDPARVWIVGYGTGAFLGQHLLALDDRPAGAAFVCGPPPFRLDTDPAETGGFERWSKFYMLAPRLGWFVGQEDRVPYDVDDLLAAAAPRPVLVVSPRLDREAPLEAVTKAVESARRAYEAQGAAQALTQHTPDTYNHFDPSMQQIVAEWLTSQNPKE